MSSLDWQELYASNRAAIRNAGISPRALPLATLPSVPFLASVRPAAPPLPGHRSFEIAGRTRRALVHVPANLPTRTPVPLVCMLHGCTQDAASFAAATRMNEAADRHGFLVVYPEQERGDNQQGCWNWFEAAHQARGAGEPEAIAGIVAAVAAPTDEWTVDHDRIFVAGLSSGGAMAAILAATYPDVFAAVAVHSGLAFGAATNMGAAFAAMASGASGAGDRGRALHTAMGTHARPVPTMVVHGTADRTVAAVNGEQVLAAAMAADHLAAPASGFASPGRPTATEQGRVEGGHAYVTRRWHDDHGALTHESLTVEGMGHAWSGGLAGGSHTDPRGPDATAAVLRFFSAVTTRTAVPAALA
jgi:poly(hydroxyalkanoate) depolymerase family esterase